MINKKISIIIPVYNLDNYIERTLDSVCSQTYKNIEIIVVDDGSKDNSYKTICDYAEKDNRIVPIHQDNGGVTSARLNGVKHATGEWIGFVDGDDLIDKDMYELLINNAHKYNAQISHCGYKMVLGTKRIDYYYNTGKIVEQDNLQGQIDLINGTMIEPGLWNKLYKKELFSDLINNNLVDLSIKNFEDLLMNYYLFKESQKSVFEDVCKYHYMVRKGSAATGDFKPHKYYNPLNVCEIIIDDANDSSVKEAIFRKYYNLVIRNAADNYPENIQKDANNRLKESYKAIIKSDYMSKKLKLMAIMIMYFKPIYKLIRKVYVKITKVDQKYLVD